MVAKRHASIGPRAEDDTHVDAAALAVLLTDSPVLLEGLGAVDGGLLVAGALVQVVRRAGVLDGAAGLSLGAGVVVAAGENKVSTFWIVVGATCGVDIVVDKNLLRLNHVVLDEGVAGPAVDAKVLCAQVSITMAHLVHI